MAFHATAGRTEIAVTMHEVEYIQNQIYLNPHPKELMLRNYV